MDSDFAKIRSDIRNGSFKYLGSGAGRRVFDMGDGHVVKIAKNRFGIQQNRTEYRLNLAYEGDLLAKVLAVSDGYGMLVMQAARPLREINPVLDYFNVETRQELTQVPELNELVRKHRLVMREFIGFRNWGLINDKPVIIDYGFRRRRRWPW